MATPQIRSHYNALQDSNSTTPTTPPLGCYIRSITGVPKVAIPSYTLESNANALLVSGKDLELAIKDIIVNSRVLKAWFAFQIACKDIDVRRSMCSWQGIKEILDENMDAWNAEYRQNSRLSIPLENLKVMDMPALHAWAVFVLFKNIQQNLNRTTNHSRTLTYHPHYQSCVAKLYLAAHILVFLHDYTKPSKPFSIHQPENLASVQRWLLGTSSHIGLACRDLERSKSHDPIKYSSTC